MKYSVVETRTEPTIKVKIGTDYYYLHSKYDPVSEANKWVSGIKPNKIKHPSLVVVGMGAGHHIRALLKKSNVKKIVVFDFNNDYSSWVLNSGLIDDLKLDDRVIYLPINNREELENFVISLNENIIIYQPSLKLFSFKHKKIKDKIENYIIQERTVVEQNDQFYNNYKLNTRLMDPGVSKQEKLKESSMILVSAGPSLTKQLPMLKSAFLSNRFVIGAVGTAFRPLMNYGIVPNFVMISDPKEQMVEQFEGFDSEQTTLFYLSTANNQAVSSFKGSRHIVWQEGFYLAEKEAVERNEPLIKTGGSVATCLLDLMVTMGAGKVALIGQDLAFTDGKSHAEHTHAMRKITSSAFLREIPNYYQNGFVYTSKNLSVYLDWFVRYVDGKNHIEFWNCTEGGAFIENWVHKPFEDYLQNIN